MAGGGGGGAQSRSLEQTPTWAVAGVCLVLVVISIVIEHVIELIGKWLKKAHKKALYEALEKIKSELMLMGFISLLLTVGQGPISKICVSKSVGDSWHPCNESEQRALNKDDGDDEHEAITRRLLVIDSDSVTSFRRVLAGGGGNNCAAKNKVPLISSDAIHQLHIFIFVLAVFHVLYCILTMALGRAKMGRWKSWEKETRTAEYQFTHDPERFRFARDTSFGRRHLNFWSRSHILIWIVCFFRQFVRSVPKVDYLTLRHGFIMAHLAPQSATKFDFQKYIKRSLEDDFKVVVGISPTIWFFTVLFLLFNTHGWYAYFWLPFIPLIIVLLVGTQLQVIITRMGLQIQDRGDVVKGAPVVLPGDKLFWFNRPGLLLYLIHFVLFQNAFQLAFFVWSWYEFGLRSCFHLHLEEIIIRISMGVLIQILCSYVTLPLYALVTQMGSNMKSTIFNERVATALRKWHRTARKHLKESRKSGSATPTSTSRPTTPAHGLSPVHLLQNYRISDADSLQTSPTRFNADSHHRRHERWEIEESTTTTTDEGGSSSYHHQREKQREMVDVEGAGVDVVVMGEPARDEEAQRGIEVGSSVSDFSFDKRIRQ
ncbi:MLO-like protein 6 [Acorus gramineus]|uniref:MLO-like protein n=1 Tax=Acorus gramineus TaxID=55184 RepID=A0AAV9AUB1_ACOGR|nr:MLO-like protein 6 [Acorus gramineus]